MALQTYKLNDVFFILVVDAWMTVKVGGYCHAVEAQRKSLAAVDGFYRHPTQKNQGTSKVEYKIAAL